MGPRKSALVSDVGTRVSTRSPSAVSTMGERVGRSATTKVYVRRLTTWPSVAALVNLSSSAVARPRTEVFPVRIRNTFPPFVSFGEADSVVHDAP